MAELTLTDSPRVLEGRDPLILMGHLTPGGNERQGYLLAKALTAAGFRPGVIVWTLTGDDLYAGLLADSGVPLVKAPQGRGAWAKMKWLRRLAKELRPSLLHAYTFFLNAAAAWAMRGTGGLAIGSMRGDYAFEAANGRVHYAANRLWPKTLIANSANSQRAAAADTSWLRPRSVLFVPNGVDISAYQPQEHRDRVRPRVLGVGNLYPGKRWDRLILAAAEIRRADPEREFVVDIVGEGGERPKLQALIEGLKLCDVVTLLGRRYDVPALLAESDVFALVSDSEGTPNAVMEAMASGLPIVATTVGDIPRLVRDRVHGYLVPPADDHQLAKALHSLLSDPSLRRTMGAAALKKARTEFDLDLLVQNTLDAYRRAGWGG